MFRSSRQIYTLYQLLQAGGIGYVKRSFLKNPHRLCTAELQKKFGDCNIKVSRSVAMSASNLGDKPDGNRLKQCLSSLQYHVTQEKGTEIPYTGKFTNFFEPGVYVCVVCKSKIFSSKTKYDSGCGWPAFSDVVEPKNVKLTRDLSHGMVRTEVTCSNCSAHLGHVFDDGPKPTGLRYCINSASLDFCSEEKIGH